MDASPSTAIRPIPIFFYEPTAFSTKKDRNLTPRDRLPPPVRPSTKKSQSVSRIFQRKNNRRALPISFKSTETTFNTPCYNENKEELFFNQCFEVISKLGEGNFGQVFKVRSREDGKFYAIKKSKNKFKNSYDRSNKLEEVLKHEKLPIHRSCVRYFKAWEERDHLYIQTELCQMNLSSYADDHHNIDEKFVWNCLVDILMAVKHLHDHDLVHMDIKPENIFISKDNVCKLGDFGLVVDLNKENDVKNALEGDPKYLAPELLSKEHFGKSADIFSVGITILELASDLDLPPRGDLWQKLRNGNLPEDLLEGRSKDLKHVIALMMEPDHEIRYTVDQLLELEFVKKIWEERMLEQDVEEEEIVPVFQGLISKTSRELLPAFDSAIIEESMTKSSVGSMDPLTPKLTPINTGSPFWLSRASSISPFFEPE